MNPSIPIFLALAESESETVAKYESQLESQLESNREFHSRQINRLRGEIDQKQKQIDNLREKNTEISSETDRLKVSSHSENHEINQKLFSVNILLFKQASKKKKKNWPLWQRRSKEVIKPKMIFEVLKKQVRFFLDRSKEKASA